MGLMTILSAIKGYGQGRLQGQAVAQQRAAVAAQQQQQAAYQQQEIKARQDAISAENQRAANDLAEQARWHDAQTLHDNAPPPPPQARPLTPLDLLTMRDNALKTVGTLPPEEQGGYLDGANPLLSQAGAQPLPVPHVTQIGTRPLNYGLRPDQVQNVQTIRGMLAAAKDPATATANFGGKTYTMADFNKAFPAGTAPVTAPFYTPDVKTQGELTHHANLDQTAANNYGLHVKQFQSTDKYHQALLAARQYEDKLRARGLNQADAHAKAMEGISRYAAQTGRMNYGLGADRFLEGEYEFDNPHPPAGRGAGSAAGGKQGLLPNGLTEQQDTALAQEKIAHQGRLTTIGNLLSVAAGKNTDHPLTPTDKINLRKEFQDLQARNAEIDGKRSATAPMPLSQSPGRGGVHIESVPGVGRVTVPAAGSGALPGLGQGGTPPPARGFRSYLPAQAHHSQTQPRHQGTGRFVKPKGKRDWSKASDQDLLRGI